MWRSKKSPDEMEGRGRIGVEPFSQMKSVGFVSELQKLQKMVMDIVGDNVSVCLLRL